MHHQFERDGFAPNPFSNPPFLHSWTLRTWTCRTLRCSAWSESRLCWTLVRCVPAPGLCVPAVHGSGFRAPQLCMQH